MTRENRSISQFKSALVGGGARPNLFEVEFTQGSFPNGVDFAPGAENFKFLCKAASLPASVNASIDVPFRGRIFKVAGDRTVENWNITVINDEDFAIRVAFEEWMQVINRLENGLGSSNPQSYMGNANVYQLGKGTDITSLTKENKSATYGLNDGNAAKLQTYQFQDIWPVNVSSIDLSMDNSDQIEEFTVEFAVQSFTRGANKTAGKGESPRTLGAAAGRQGAGNQGAGGQQQQTQGG